MPELKHEVLQDPIEAKMDNICYVPEVGNIASCRGEITFGAVRDDEDSSPPIKVNLQERIELGYVDKQTGNVILRLDSTRSWDVTNDKHYESIDLTESRYAPLLSCLAIVDNEATLVIGHSASRDFFNCASRVAASSFIESKVVAKGHAIQHFMRNTPKIKYREVCEEEELLKEKMSVIYMFTPEGIVAVPMNIHVKIREYK